MGLYNGKTTTNMPLLCSDPNSVNGEHQDLEQSLIMSNLQGVSQRKAY